MHVSTLLGPLEVYLPEKCDHSETSRTLVQVSDPLSPYLSPLPLSDCLVVWAVSAGKKGGAQQSSGWLYEPGQ